jgi:hypothetical protein
MSGFRSPALELTERTRLDVLIDFGIAVSQEQFQLLTDIGRKKNKFSIWQKLRSLRKLFECYRIGAKIEMPHNCVVFFGHLADKKRSHTLQLLVTPVIESDILINYYTLYFSYFANRICSRLKLQIMNFVYRMPKIKALWAAWGIMINAVYHRSERGRIVPRSSALGQFLQRNALANAHYSAQNVSETNSSS